MVDAIDAWVDVIFFAVATASSATAPAELKFSAVELFLVLDGVLVLVGLGPIAPAAHADQRVELSPLGQLPLLAVWPRVGVLLVDWIVAREDLIDLLEERP